jgi:Fic family protein
MGFLSIMTWNWQQPDWPRFTWDASRLARMEARFLEGAGITIGTSKHLSADTRQNLMVEIVSLEAVDTSLIEGERLDRASVQSSIQRQLGILGDNRRPRAAEAGIAEMMVDLYRHLPRRLAEADALNWHRLIMNGRSDIGAVGAYRTHADPMQIVSGPLHAPRVHFEAPPFADVPSHMHCFFDWLDRTAPEGTDPLPALLRAGVAHLWFESVHPFEGGNGRVGRAIIEKLLAQGLSSTAMTGISGTLLAYRKDYYAQLERASCGLDLTDWLVWFGEMALEAQSRTLAHVELILEKSRLFDRLGNLLNNRQERALNRMFAAGIDGFKGGLSAANYRTITDATSATATRDLAALVEWGALRRIGALKSTRYYLNIPGASL